MVPSAPLHAGTSIFKSRHLNDMLVEKNSSNMGQSSLPSLEEGHFPSSLWFAINLCPSISTLTTVHFALRNIKYDKA
ncbi:hypothetical protein ACFX13_041438 [Malus domestica]